MIGKIDKDQVFLFRGMEFYSIPLHGIIDSSSQLFLLYNPRNRALQLLEQADILQLREHCVENVLSVAEKEQLELLSEGGQVKLETPPAIPEEYTKLSLLLNNRCNFSCEYCYSAGGRCREELSLSDIDVILQFFIDPIRVSSRFLSFFISGGGEPFMSEHKLLYLLEAIDTRCTRHGFKYQVIVVTNGSLITSTTLSQLKKYSVHLSVSFELTRKAQELHRGHYDTVRDKLKTMISAGHIPSITSTITPENVDEMPAMFQILCNDFPEIRNWSTTPVIDRNMEVQEASAFYQKFTDLFFQITDHRQKKEFEVGFPFYWRLTGIRTRFCPGKLCVNFNKDVVICPFASVPSDPDYVKYTYGRLENSGQFKFDHDKFTSIIEENNSRLSSPECSNCFLKLHCAGICFNRSLQYGASFKECICRFYRNFAARYFFREYDTAFSAQVGMSVEKYLKENN